MKQREFSCKPSRKQSRPRPYKGHRVNKNDLLLALCGAIFVGAHMWDYAMCAPEEPEDRPVAVTNSVLMAMEREAAEPVTEPEPAYLGEFTITHYCCEKYEHICGTGDGITASGTEVTPYRSCAVDPDVIPLGSKVILYMEDGRILRYIAEDTGGAIDGNRIDLALPTHEEALQAGITTASVYVEVRDDG